MLVVVERSKVKRHFKDCRNFLPDRVNCIPLGHTPHSRERASSDFCFT